MSINEIIEFIKSNPEIEIKISGFNRMDGYFQLSSEIESKSIKHTDLFDEYNGHILKVETDKEGNQTVEFHPEFKERSVHLSLTGEPHENFFPNLKKQIYQDYYYEWEEGIIENKSFLKHLNEFVEENDENSNECDFDGFIEHIQDSFGCFIDEVAGAFDVNDGKCGKGREVGIDELSWCFSDYLKDGQIDISGYLNNKQVFCGGY
tara:strand:+ start:738 stop:1355 length:618 start_codon:yes stop_codon:yes gene_type:complete